MKPGFIIALIATIFSTISSAQNISGEWVGYLDQTLEASTMPGYSIFWQSGEWVKGRQTHDLRFTFSQNDSTIEGIYDINSFNNKNHRGIFNIAGKFSENKLHYESTKLIKEIRDSLSIGEFCHSKSILYYYKENEYEVLEGHWDGWLYGNPCAAAWIQVKRKINVSNSDPLIPAVDSLKSAATTTGTANAAQSDSSDYNLMKNINLELYPNPNKGEFTIQFENKNPLDLTLSIKNSIGQIIFTEQLPTFEGIYKKTMLLTNLPAGLYFIRLDSKNAVVSKKLIIQ